MPVIFTDLASDITPAPWNAAFIRRECGHVVTGPLHPHALAAKTPTSSEGVFGGLEPTREMSLADFLDHWEESPAEPMYVHDFNIQRDCPHILQVPQGLF